MSILAPLRNLPRLANVLPAILVILAAVHLAAPSLAETSAAPANPLAPYNLDKFKPILDASKLQAPTSSPTMIEHGQFADQSNEYFFLDDTGQHMTFTVTGDSNRSELRQMNGDWLTSTPTPQRLRGRVKVFVPETPSLNQYTWMQIHDTNAGINKPLIRLVWYRDRKGVTDHLWAAIRIPAEAGTHITDGELSSEWIDLGPRPDGFFESEIYVQNNRMTVKFDGQTLIDKDVAYWDGLPNYFKAGVYNQDEGTSKVQYDALEYLTD